MITQNAWPVGLICAFSVQSLYHTIFVSLGTLCYGTPSTLSFNLYSLKKSRDGQTLSHVNLVLQDGGILSPSSSEEEDDPPSTPDPKRLKSLAIRPPTRQTAEEVDLELPSSTHKNLTVEQGVKSSHNTQESSSQVLPRSESPLSSLQGSSDTKDDPHGHGHCGNVLVSPSVDPDKSPCNASQPHGHSGSPVLQDAYPLHLDVKMVKKTHLTVTVMALGTATVMAMAKVTSILSFQLSRSHSSHRNPQDYRHHSPEHHPL